MSDLKERLDRELGPLPISEVSPDSVRARAEHRARRRQSLTLVSAMVIAVGSFVLLVRTFGLIDTSPADRGSPQGLQGRIVFGTIPFPEVRGQLFSIRPDGTDLTQLTPPDAHYGLPALSPDGSALAFDRFERDGPGGREGIYIANSDGSEMRELVRTGVPKPISVRQIRWSPDGTSLGYIDEQMGGPSESDFTIGLFVVGLDGSSPQRLIEGQVESFSWSPDGSRIAFARRSTNGNRFVLNIFVMNADGSGVEQITNDGGSHQPAWSPDGGHIAFLQCCGTGPNVYVMEPDGSDVRAIGTSAVISDSLAWSPDSRHVVVDGYERATARCSLRILSLDGEDDRVLFSQQSPLTPPSPPTPANLESADPEAGNHCVGSVAWGRSRAE